MINGLISDGTVRFILEEIEQLRALVDNLLTLAEVKFNINEQTQRDINTTHTNVERVFRKQDNIRIMLGDLKSRHIRSQRKAANRFAEIERSVCEISDRLAEIRLG